MKSEVTFVSLLFVSLFMFSRNVNTSDVSKLRRSSFSFGNILSDRSRRLDSHSDLLQEIQVKSFSECVLACVQNGECESTNFETKTGIEKRKCELMKSDKYKRERNIIDDGNFAHVHFKTPCSEIPCSNGGTCLSEYTTGGYSCACAAGFTGQNCETNINECSSSPCQNDGSCTDGVNGYTCLCANGYSGDTCHININECSSSPCQNGGACTDGVNGYTCSCGSGYSGNNCQININECSSNPCKNGGSCTDGVNGYTCLCANGYAGDTCHININECSSSPCQNGGACTDGVNGYTCSCASGYSGNNCQININECSSNPCKNGGTCVDGVNGYTCSCASGYSGDICQLQSGTDCGQRLHHDPNTKDMTTNFPVPAGWTLCFIDETDTAYHSTPCRDLILNVKGYATYTELLNAGGNFGCWHGKSGSQEGASYSGNNAVQNACQNDKQQTSVLSSWDVQTTTLTVCLKVP